MKIKLLNDGGYKVISHLNFPVVVDAYNSIDWVGFALVEKTVFKKLGCDIKLKGWSFVVFEIGTECELVAK